jgi:hypothetical protein
MYLVFDLPPSVEHMFPSAHTVAFWLHREFDKWSDRYQIAYKTKFHKSRMRFILASEQEYHFFMLTWNPNMMLSNRTIEDKWSKFEVVEPPNH